MNIDKMIEQWEEKHSSLLDEYSKGNTNNEVMQMYRSQMKNVLDFINQLMQIKTDVMQQSGQLFCGLAKKGFCLYEYENGKCRAEGICINQIIK